MGVFHHLFPPPFLAPTSFTIVHKNQTEVKTDAITNHTAKAVLKVYYSLGDD